MKKVFQTGGFQRDSNNFGGMEVIDFFWYTKRHPGLRREAKYHKKYVCKTVRNMANMDYVYNFIQIFHFDAFRLDPVVPIICLIPVRHGLCSFMTLKYMLKFFLYKTG